MRWLLAVVFFEAISGMAPLSTAIAGDNIAHKNISHIERVISGHSRCADTGLVNELHNAYLLDRTYFYYEDSVVDFGDTEVGGWVGLSSLLHSWCSYRNGEEGAILFLSVKILQHINLGKKDRLTERSWPWSPNNSFVDYAQLYDFLPHDNEEGAIVRSIMKFGGVGTTEDTATALEDLSSLSKSKNDKLRALSTELVRFFEQQSKCSDVYADCVHMLIDSVRDVESAHLKSLLAEIYLRSRYTVDVINDALRKERNAHASYVMALRVWIIFGSVVFVIYILCEAARFLVSPKIGGRDESA
jgi:hypothetical protein